MTSAVLAHFVGVLFDGVAYGALLFLISVGLSITMGLMNFVNLAHGAFAMLGGYTCVLGMARLGLPFLLTLPLAFVVSAAVGAVLERTLYRRLYEAGHLDQVLFSIGLTFVAVAATTYAFGPTQQAMHLPPFLRGQSRLFGLELGTYRLFLVGVVTVVTSALVYLVEHTRFGAQLRAAVDDRDVAAGVGIDVRRIFTLTFALGSGLAGLGGGLGADVLGLDPTFPLEFLVYFLLVVSVGGQATLRGPFVAALLLGVFDVACKYYVPAIGTFGIYALMVILLVAFPTGLYGKRA